MSRIRSIHPGLFTDEAFMSAAIPTRVLLIGLWTEAWDDGVFEWKPLTLKARLFPVDAVNVEEMLSELTQLGFIGPFFAKEKKFGAIRNFQKWQRPKKPNSSGVLPPDLVLFVGKSETGSEPVPDQFGTGEEKSPQMEEVGGRKEEIKEKTLREGAEAPPVLQLVPDPPPQPMATADAEFYRRGKEILGQKAGGFLRNLLTAQKGSVALARAALETASTKADPKEYLGGLLRAREKDSDLEQLRLRGEAW